MKKTAFTIMALSALAACGKSGAENTAPEPPEKLYARQAVQLFYKTCLDTAADETKLAAWAQQNKLPELDARQKREFNFEPEAKRVWGVHSKPDGRFFLASGSAYCSVKAKIADPATIESEIAALAAQAADSLGLQTSVVKEGALPNVPMAKQTVYALEKQGAPTDLLLAVYTDSRADAGAQAVLNLRFVRADRR